MIQQQMAVYSAQADQQRNGMAADIQDAYEGVQLAMEKLDLAKLTADNLDLQYQLLKTENQYGTATNQDLLNASVNAANGQTALQKARSDAQLAVLLLQNVMGY